METQSSILALEVPIDRGDLEATIHGVAGTDMAERPENHVELLQLQLQEYQISLLDAQRGQQRATVTVKMLEQGPVYVRIYQMYCLNLNWVSEKLSFRTYGPPCSLLSRCSSGQSDLRLRWGQHEL